MNAQVQFPLYNWHAAQHLKNKKTYEFETIYVHLNIDISGTKRARATTFTDCAPLSSSLLKNI